MTALKGKTRITSNPFTFTDLIKKNHINTANRRTTGNGDNWYEAWVVVFLLLLFLVLVPLRTASSLITLST